MSYTRAGDLAGLSYCWTLIVKIRASMLLALLFMSLFILVNAALIAGAFDCGSATPSWLCRIAAWFAG